MQPSVREERRTSSARIFTRNVTVFSRSVAMLWTILTMVCIYNGILLTVRLYAYSLCAVLWCDWLAVSISETNETFFPIGLADIAQFSAKIFGSNNNKIDEKDMPEAPALSDWVPNGHSWAFLPERTTGQSYFTSAEKKQAIPPIQPSTKVQRGTALTAHVEWHSATVGQQPREPKVLTSPATSSFEVACIQLKQWISTALFDDICAKIRAVDAWCVAHNLAMLSTENHLHRIIPSASLEAYQQLLGPQTSKCTGTDLIARLQQTCQSPNDANAIMLKSRLWLEEVLRVEETFSLSNAALRANEWKQRRAHIKARCTLFALDRSLYAFQADMTGAVNARAAPADSEIILHVLLRYLPGLQRFFRFGHQSLFSTDRFADGSECFALFYSVEADAPQCALQRVFPEGKLRAATAFADLFDVDGNIAKLRITAPATANGFFQGLALWVDRVQRALVVKQVDPRLAEAFDRIGLRNLLLEW